MTLIERDRELAILESAVKDATSGRGGTVLIEGHPGIGKTALLDHARESATRAGLRVLYTGAVELESDLGFSVLRTMFEPLLETMRPDERSTMLAGAARLATGPLGVSDAADPAPVDLGSALHGIYWLCANLAERQPLLLAIDDLHWADEPSLQFLTYLSRRVSEHPVMVCATTRPSHDEPAARFLNAIGAEPAEVLRPETLTDDGVDQLVGAKLSAQPDPEFVAACAKNSGGNPFLLVEALDALHASGIEPTADAADQIGELRAETLARSLLTRISRLGPRASRVATAAAILGADADLRLVARLADLDAESVSSLVSGLRREGILRSNGRLDFVHPLIRTAVYSDIEEPERGLSHLRAAKLLDEEGALARVPPHLVLAERNADSWVVDRLRAAGASMLTQGAPATAAVFLERALAEPAASSERPSLGLELGRALGLSGDLDAAAAALRDALVLVDDPVAGATISMELGRVLRFAGRIPEAVTVLDAAVAHLPDGHHDEHVALEAEIAIASHMGLPAKVWIDRLASVVDHAQGSSLPDRTVRSMFGYVAACTGTRTGAQVAQIARSAIAQHRDQQDSPLILQSVGAGLAMSGAYAEALAVLDRALAGSQARGDAAEFGFASLTRTWVAHRSGRVLEGEADARAILAIPSVSPIYGTFAAAHVVFALIERGDLDEADRVLVEHGVADGAIPDTIAGAVILMARGRLHRVRGRTRESVTDLDRCREVVEQIGFTGPALGEWRTDQALAQLAASERELALATAVEEEGLSRSFGVPRELGIALRTRGLVEGGHRGLELLADSVDVLAGSEAVLEHAKSLVEHGAALRRAGKNVPGAERLRQGLDLASRCGAIALAARARDELITAGGRPRRERLRGPDSLTASELRVARMAAEGRSNPEIAQALFVTRRTVEVHLTHAYRKLGIESRDALAAALQSDER